MALYTAVGSIIIAASVIDDLMTKKIHNWLIIASLVIAIACIAYSGSSFFEAGLSFALLFALSAPLFALGALGGGDAKLFMVLSLLMPWSESLNFFFYSMVWGALFGLVRSVLDGKGLLLIKNIFKILKSQNKEEIELQKVPFSIAILFGWLTTLSLGGAI